MLILRRSHYFLVNITNYPVSNTNDIWHMGCRDKNKSTSFICSSFEYILVSPYFFEALDAISNQFAKLEPRYLHSIQHDWFGNVWFNPIRPGLLGGIKSRGGGGYKKPQLWKPSSDRQNTLKFGLSNIWDISYCLKLLWLILCINMYNMSKC